MKPITLRKDNHYLQHAELIRALSKDGPVDLFVACKKLDLLYPEGKDDQACKDFLHECNRIGLDAVMDTYGQ